MKLILPMTLLILMVTGTSMAKPRTFDDGSAGLSVGFGAHYGGLGVRKSYGSEAFHGHIFAGFPFTGVGAGLQLTTHISANASFAILTDFSDDECYFDCNDDEQKPTYLAYGLSIESYGVLKPGMTFGIDYLVDPEEKSNMWLLSIGINF